MRKKGGKRKNNNKGQKIDKKPEFIEGPVNTNGFITKDVPFVADKTDEVQRKLSEEDQYQLDLERLLAVDL